jgi:hypothetical protein
VQIERKQFQEWLEHPVTLEVKKHLKSHRDDMTEGLMGYVANIEMYAEGVGRYGEINDYLEMTYDDLKGE